MIRISLIRGFVLAAALVVVPLIFAPSLAAGGNEVRKINQQGNQFYTGDQWADALAEYTAAGEIDPENPVLHYNLGNTLYRLNDLDKAETHYRVAAAAEDPELARRARFNLGNTAFRRAETLEGAGDWQGRNQALATSIDHWRSVLDAEPGNLDAKLNLELARRKLLEEPPENQQQQDQQEQDEEQDQEQDQQDQQQQDQEDQQEEQEEDGEQEQESETDGEEQQQEQQTDQQQEQEQQAGEEQAEEMRISPEEAQRILDALRDEELEEQRRQMAERKGKGGSAERDW
jgi:Ca-activated chloride channel family protein